jgi:hypothetical protein
VGMGLMMEVKNKYPGWISYLSGSCVRALRRNHRKMFQICRPKTLSDERRQCLQMEQAVYGNCLVCPCGHPRTPSRPYSEHISHGVCWVEAGGYLDCMFFRPCDHGILVHEDPGKPLPDLFRTFFLESLTKADRTVSFWRAPLGRKAWATFL